MKIYYSWQEEQPADEIIIRSNPINKEQVHLVEEALKKSETVAVINPLNNRTVILALTEIERIDSFGHLCKVFTEEQQEFLLQKRLKEVEQLNFANFQRINNSTVLNISKVSSFAAGEHARLEIYTKKNQKYIVSRHYAKLIKERVR